MAVAMKDLELRGAGNVLGAEQSGHVAGVGFDLYVRLVGEAVEAYRAAADGRPIATEEDREVRIDLPVDAQIRSEEHTSELQSLMRISYAVFCLKKKKKT